MAESSELSVVGESAGDHVLSPNRVTKANASVQQKTFQHTPQDFTIKRAEQRNLETLALAEAMGEWICALLKEDKVLVRGSEGFFEDVSDGVVLCKVLQKLGIPVDKPKNSPKNEFEVKENRQKFQTACKKAKFLSVPAIDYSDPTIGLLPTLIECAAIDEAQKKRRLASSIVPAAITKRTDEVSRSPAVLEAATGKTAPEGLTNSSVKNPEQLSPTTPSKEQVRERVGSGTAGSIGSRDGRARTISRDDAARTQRSRTVSEIPKEEKDQIVTMFIVGIIIALILFYLLVRLLS